MHCTFYFSEGEAAMSIEIPDFSITGKHPDSSESLSSYMNIDIAVLLQSRMILL